MARRGDWRGSVFKPKDKPTLWLKVKVDGVWKSRPTTFLPGQEREALELLAEVRLRLQAADDVMEGRPGAVTVRAWGKAWLANRVDQYGDDARTLKLHLYPAIGEVELAELEARQVLKLVQEWKAAGAAPRTIRNRYSTLHSMCRDAVVEGLLKANPCVLRRGPHLPTIEDADAEWRASAVYTRKELELLLRPHEAIEPDSTVAYALLGLAALRHGEMAGLRWRNLDQERAPLASLLVWTTYGLGRTKKHRTRLMPVHPVLAAVLAEWKLHGWARLIGRAPTEDDLILPLPAGTARAGVPGGARTRRLEVKRRELLVGADTRMRTKDHTWERLNRHLEVLKLRHRRVHDLRRTMISLARADGADKDVLRWGTHGRSGDIMDAYTEMDWKRLCGEVLKLRITRARGAAKVRSIR